MLTTQSKSRSLPCSLPATLVTESRLWLKMTSRGREELHPVTSRCFSLEKLAKGGTNEGQVL